MPWPPERQKIDIGDVYSSYALVRDTLGWEPRVELREGLERTVGFYREYKDKYW